MFVYCIYFDIKKCLNFDCFAGLGNYDDLDLDNLTPDELTANDLDDIKTKDLDDVKTADTIDLNLTVDDLHTGADLGVSDDEDLSIDHLQ